MKKYNWEPRTQLTTISKVEQPDDDTLVYFRRVESFGLPVPAWEKVTINRKDMKMTTETLSKNSDRSTCVLDSQTFTPDGQHVLNQMEVFNLVGKSTRVDQYKKGVENILKAVKFSQYESEE